MKLKFKKLHPEAIIPKYQTIDAAGFDFHVYKNFVVQPHQRIMIPSGLAVEIPRGFEMQIRQRSGLSTKYSNYLANSIGTIDSDYRGEIKFPIANHQNHSFE